MIKINGREFETQIEAGKYYGVPAYAIAYALVEENPHYYLTEVYKPRKKPITVFGKAYPSYKNACEDLKISLTSFYKGLKSGNLESYITRLKEAKANGTNQKAQAFYIDDTEYWTIKDASRKLGVIAPIISFTLKKCKSNRITREEISNSIKESKIEYVFHEDLEQLIEDINSGKTDAKDYIHNQSVSLLQISLHLGFYISMHRLILNSELYLKFRELVFAIIDKLPDGQKIKGINRKYFSTPESELIDLAAKYKGWTELCKKNHQLYNEVKGRNLEMKVVRTNPQMARHFQVGYGNIMYRSEPELICGNLLFLNKIEFEKDKKLHLRRDGSNKSLISDFYFKDIDFHLEIAQNFKGDRGIRRENYVKRNKSKKEIYERHNINYHFFDSDVYYDHGTIDVQKYVDDLIETLSKKNIKINQQPDLKVLLYQDDSEKKYLLSLETTTEDIIDYILNKKGISGMQELRNNYSYIVTSIKYRSDYDEIIKGIKDLNEIKKSENLSKAHEEKKLRGEPWKNKSKSDDFAKKNHFFKVPSVITKTGKTAWQVKNYARKNNLLKKYNCYFFSVEDIEKLNEKYA